MRVNTGLWMCALALLLAIGCEVDIEDYEDEIEEAEEEYNAENDSSSGGADPAELVGITWIYGCDISSWPKTITLTAEGGGHYVYLHYDVMQNWPPWNNNEYNVNGSCWVVFTYNGVKYASTFDYLRVGQVKKEAPVIPTPSGTWRPSSGETVGFMVSGMARDARRTVNERSNVYYTIWQ
ncbi:MAG: hypothetical protein JXN60_03780 [Lentisphaerae bacterium]|nr:hypothetical protein [Lentisphaerota bacterium]